MSEWKAKRFWEKADVAPTEDGGFTVELDGRPVRTPAKSPLVLPNAAYAQAVADEWQAQEGVIDPRSMPCTRTANSAIDKVATQQQEVADMLAAYGDADLLCYRAENPEELSVRQSEAWDPLLDWADNTLGARLGTRTGIVHEAQDPAALAELARRVQAMTPFELAAFHDLVSLSGSLILALAATEGAYSPEELWELSRLDEEWQAEQWGRDEEADALAAVKKESFLHAARMFDLARGK